METEKFALIARGGQADIYDMQDGKVVRVPRREMDYARIRYEYDVYKGLEWTHLRVPKVYALLEADGRPSIVMDYLPGKTMIALLQENPLLLPFYGRRLAELHVEVLSVRDTRGLCGASERSVSCIGKASLPEDLKLFARDVLGRTENGCGLCHGDFHPGNILMSPGKEFIIDWSSAYAGTPVSDIATTYLLMRVVPRVPGVSESGHFVQKLAAGLLSRIYLAQMRKRLQFDMADFSRWLLVRAAERMYYGLASERFALVRFIERYRKAFDSHRAEKSLYRLL
jgi:aminoglycoside phosphotransferase (APT) family kinase protein